MRRFIIISVLILTGLAVATTGVVYYLANNEAFLKDQLRSQTLKYTGRELTVKGPLELRLGKVTTLEASDLHFANAPWAEEPDMATVGSLNISIDLSTVLSGQIIFPSLSLENCRVNLARNDQDEPNWDIGPVEPPEPDPSAPPLTTLPVVFRDLQIQSCDLSLTSPKILKPLRLKIAGLSAQHSENGNWQGKGTGSLNDRPLAFDGSLSPFDALFTGGPLQQHFELSFGDYNAQSSGTFKDAKTGDGADLTARVYGPDIGELLHEFKLPVFSEGAFDYELKLNTEGRMTRLDLDGDLGTVDIRASGKLDRLVKPREGNVRISVDGPNLGKLAQVFGLEGLVEDTFKHESHLEFAPDAVHVRETQLQTGSDRLQISGHLTTSEGLAGTDLDIDFSSDEAGRWTTVFGQAQQKMGPLVVSGKLAVDSNRLISIDAQAGQDSTNLNVKGTLGSLPDSIAPKLELSLDSPDPSHLAAIAGLTMAPATPLTLNGHFGYDGQQIRLGEVRIDLAGDRADIDGAVNLSNRYAGSQLNLQVDIQNAGRLGRLFGREGFPDQPVKLGAEVKPEGNGLSFKVTDGNLGDIQLELDGLIPDLQQPLMMDGSFDINLPRLDDLTLFLPNLDLPDAPFSARGKLESGDNGVQLNDVVINLAEDQITVNGVLKLENRFAGSDLRAKIDVKNAAALGRLFGQPGLPEEPFRLNLEVSPLGNGMAFKVQDGGLRDGRLTINGEIEDMGKPMMMNARFDIELPRLSAISFLVPGKELPDLPFTANGNLQNLKSKTRLEQVRMTLGEMNGNIEGDLLADNRFDLQIRAAGPDASILGKMAGQSLPEDPFSVSTALAGNPDEFTFSDLEAALGESRVNGNMTVGLGERTRISGDVQSPYLDLRHWTAATDPVEPPPERTTPPEWRFDDTPVMQAAPQGLDVNTSIRVSDLLIFNTSLADIELGISISEQLIEVAPYNFKGVQGGLIQGDLRLDASGFKPKMLLKVQGDDIRLGLASAPGQDPATIPPLELDIFLDGEGNTRREMASSLNGKIRVYQGSGQVAKAGLDLVFSDFLTQLFTQLNPFAKSSEYTQVDCSVYAADAENGEIKVFPVILHTGQLTILSEGTIDLHTEDIDLSFNTKPRKGLGLSAGALINPLIKVGGRLTSPAVELDPEGAVANTGIAVATVGISLLAKSLSDRFLSSKDPCGDARKEIAKRDGAAD